MTNYTEFINKAQSDILASLKQAQENNAKAIATFGDTIAEYAAKAKTMSADAKVPTPTEVIESAFGFTSQLVELQKNYYIKLAETFASAQKKATDLAAPASKK